MLGTDGNSCITARDPQVHRRGRLKSTSSHADGFMGVPSAQQKKYTPRHRFAGGRAGRRATSLPLFAVVVLMGAAMMLWQETSAVFTATTANPANSWQAGSVALADDDSGTAMFNASGLTPGATGSNCITVTYTGTLPTVVKVYASASADASSAAQYLDINIIEGTGGGFGSCGAFVAATTIYTGTLATFTTTKTGYSTGVGTWAPSSPASKIYKITYTLNAATPASKQSAVTSCTLQWEAQS